MISNIDTFALQLPSLGTSAAVLNVRLSNELVTLLSEQMYRSPLKAIEELVVNAYDADAKICRVYVPSSMDSHSLIAVFDDGDGMDKEGLENLWHIGRSGKVTDEVTKRMRRAKIGKFGIGKLATYTITKKLTYITRVAAQILSVSIDFEEFQSAPSGAEKPVQLTVREIEDWSLLLNHPVLKTAFEGLGVDVTQYFDADTEKSWTLVLLEDLKPKGQSISPTRLERVLRTAMPLRSRFSLYLNGKHIESAKLNYKTVVRFEIKDLDQERLEALEAKLEGGWERTKYGIKCNSFPSGVTGSVIVTERSLMGNKSDDLSRSHGFFVYVRDRLINEEDPLFGLTPRSHGTFNFFRADVFADDLNSSLKAARDGFEEDVAFQSMQALLLELFNQARELERDAKANQLDREKNKVEHNVVYVNPSVVEEPVADVIAMAETLRGGAEADNSWFYLDLDETLDREQTVRAISNARERGRYTYKYINSNASNRLVKFDPVKSIFYVNESHPLVLEHRRGETQIFLEDFVTAEAMLEVYLREASVAPPVVGEILEKRDKLLRSLVADHPFSLRIIAENLRRSSADERDLEFYLVGAARALGFVATHLSGAKKPDGVARIKTSEGNQTITLEAKASTGTPELSQLDFGGLTSHRKKHLAVGCLLVAPSYPGMTLGNKSEVARRARDGQISCWTVEQLASVVEAVDARYITAQDILEITKKAFTPLEVTDAIKNLFELHPLDLEQLHKDILSVFKELNFSPGISHSVGLILGRLYNNEKYKMLEERDLLLHLARMAEASKGTIRLGDNNVTLLSTIGDLERRLVGMTNNTNNSMRLSTFRNGLSVSSLDDADISKSDSETDE